MLLESSSFMCRIARLDPKPTEGNYTGFEQDSRDHEGALRHFVAECREGLIPANQGMRPPNSLASIASKGCSILDVVLVGSDEDDDLIGK